MRTELSSLYQVYIVRHRHECIREFQLKIV